MEMVWIRNQIGCKPNRYGSRESYKNKNEIKASGGIAPDSLCVICGLSNAAYQRPDGVFVVPITALRN